MGPRADERRHHDGEGQIMRVRVLANVVVSLLVAGATVIGASPSSKAFHESSLSAALSTIAGKCLGTPNQSQSPPGATSFDDEIETAPPGSGMSAKASQDTTVSGSTVLTVRSSGSTKANGSNGNTGCHPAARAGSDFSINLQGEESSYAYRLHGSITTTGTGYSDTASGSGYAGVGFDSFSAFASTDPGETRSISVNESGVTGSGSTISAGSDAIVGLAPDGGTANGTGSWDLTLTLTPNVAGLYGTVTDGHGHALAGVKVQLHDISGAPVGSPVTSDAFGGYAFPASVAAPGSYLVRATLIDATNNPPLFRTLYKNGPDPVYAERLVNAPDFDASSSTDDVEFDSARSISNLPDDDKDRIDDVAAIHYRAQQYVDWLVTKLGVDKALFGTAHIKTYDTTPTSDTDPDPRGTRYRSTETTVFVGESDSDYGVRDVANDEGPENVEWHELTHHVGEVYDLAPNVKCLGRTDMTIVNHGGWNNPYTCDSFAEGLASFLPTIASKDIDGATDNTYSGYGSLETNAWKAWSRANDTVYKPKEELAVASLLWDLLDTEADQLGSYVWEDPSVGDPDLDDLDAVTYTDDVALSLQTLWGIITSEVLGEPGVDDVRTLQVALETSSSVPANLRTESIDLDNDGTPETRPIEIPFLMKGFHTADERLDQPFRSLYELDSVVGRTDHVPDGSGLEVRLGLPHTPGSAVLVRNDAPVPTVATVRVDYETDAAIYEVPLGPGAEELVPIELPPYHPRFLLPGDEPPTCGADDDFSVALVVSSPLTDPLEIDSCHYEAAVAASGGEPALTYSITPPDASIKRPSDASAVGDDIYNTDGSGQSLLTKVKRGKTAIYQITVQNDTDAPDIFDVTGCRSSKGFKVSYFDGATNVTSQITGAGFSTPTLGPAETESVEVRIKVGRSGPKNKSCLVTSTSQNSPSLRDTVRGNVKAKG